MTILDAIILGIVEGITEYLPVSSTGHLIITSWLLGLDESSEQAEAVNAFNIIIQGGAILAVLGLYRKRVLQMIRGLAGRDVAGRKLFTNLVIAFIPAAILGVLLDDIIERHLFTPIPVIAALFLGGILLLGMRRWQDRIYAAQNAGPGSGSSGDHEEREADRFVDIEALSWKSALIIGFLQCVAMWPGTSRSMMTIVGGMFMGLRPRQAAEFSFLLGLPTLGGACVYKLGKALLRDGDGFITTLGGWVPVAVGIAVATLAAAVAIKWLVEWLASHGLALFGWWRIALSVFLGGAIYMGWFTITPPADAEMTGNGSTTATLATAGQVDVTPEG
ncbi:MAG: undecaprenyl-diphosphate phosphatase [Phycisphaerales bacterium]|nr:undecaprenyl-diphosphate phosphatase [Phycisphaerales bacterium]